jgi:hypothetical protein
MRQPLHCAKSHRLRCSNILKWWGNGFVRLAFVKPADMISYRRAIPEQRPRHSWRRSPFEEIDMRLLFPLLSIAAIAAAPLSAAGLAETHQELAVPAGKIHAKAFRPLAPQPCTEAKGNPSGARPASTQPVRITENCAKTEMARRG